jgi:hypothetical protein
MSKTIGIAMLVLLLSSIAQASAEQAKGPYPAPASFEQFRFNNPSEEIALARSAAPASISNDAEILTLGSQGYETAAKGKNGFVCLVERSWANSFDKPEFWNPKMRSPLCMNAAAVSSVLPAYLERTRWVLANVPKTQMAARTAVAIQNHTIKEPLPGSMSYMMSKQGYLNDEAHHWHPHVMFFMPRMDHAAWGADLPGGEVFADDDDSLPITLFFVLAPKWSDGSLAFPENH